MKNIHTQEAGRSMVEMLGVLAIIGVLSVGGIAGYSQAMSKFKVTKTTDQIQQMVTGIRTLFASQKTYAGVGNSKTLYSTGVFTDDICPDGANCATPMNPYGGDIIVFPLTDDKSRANRAFGIIYNGLPSDACVRLAIQGWGDASSGLLMVQAHSSGLVNKASIGSVTGGSFAKTNIAGDVPMSMATAASACGTGTGDTSAIALYYK